VKEEKGFTQKKNPYNDKTYLTFVSVKGSKEVLDA
jgi:hypothetical protein